MWPRSLWNCFLLSPEIILFPLEQRNNVVEKWVPDLLGKWDTVKRIKETKTIAVVRSKLEAVEAWDKRWRFGASKMTEAWEGRRGRWFTIAFERHWLEYLLACRTLLGLEGLPLFSKPFPSFKAINRKRAWKMAMDAWYMVFERESAIRLWPWWGMEWRRCHRGGSSPFRTGLQQEMCDWNSRRGVLVMRQSFPHILVWGNFTYI